MEQIGRMAWKVSREIFSMLSVASKDQPSNVCELHPIPNKVVNRQIVYVSPI